MTNKESFFDTTKCSAEQLRILRNFALMPSVAIPTAVTVWIQCEEKNLKALTDSGWLDFRQTENTSDGYYMHPTGYYIYPTGYYLRPLAKETILLDKKQFPASIGKEFVDCLANGNYITSGEDRYTVLYKKEIAESVLTEMGVRETVAYGAACDKLATECLNYGFHGAEKYYLKALTIYEKVLGAEHPDTAAICNNLGVLYHEQNSEFQAEDYYRKALDIRVKVLGTEHPDTATTYHNFAAFYHEQLRHSEAERYYREALYIREKVLGTDHPDTVAIYDDLVRVCFSQKKYFEAEDYCLKALAIREKVFGTEHPDTADTYSNIAELCYSQRKYREAVNYYSKAVAIYEKVLGAEHPDTATAYENLARVYRQQRRYKKAEEYYSKAHSNRKKGN